MTANQLRQKYLNFFAKKGHKIIPSASLVPDGDSSSLFISSGMQPLIPYLLGQSHPLGNKIANSQLCIRTEDIEEVGDNRHTTFFEMLGNWSLGDYFKKKQLEYFWEFLIKKLGFPKEKLYISIFAGDKKTGISKDEESKKIWQDLGVSEDHIHEYGVDKNWWSRSGPPSNMPAGEIGGPDSEVFFEFTQVEHDTKYGKECHPNCDCGRFLEIGNSVFIQYQKQKDGTLKELDQKNVDFGGGLERLIAAANNNPDIFKTDIFNSAIEKIEKSTGKQYQGKNEIPLRVIADHLKAATFLVAQGLEPSNKQQGYLLRRLIRRAILKMRHLGVKSFARITDDVIIQISKIYSSPYPEVANTEKISQIIIAEINKFEKTLEKGIKEFNRQTKIDGKTAFNLFQSYGFPFELTKELVEEQGGSLNQDEFKAELEKHQKLSHTASAGMFKGGLADHSETTTKYHTATHLLHQALRDVLGSHVKQAGSNITVDRLRFDFSHDKALTEQELKKVTQIINQKIDEGLKVTSKSLPKEKALKLVSVAQFTDRYPEIVTVYAIGNYSKEICAGPHVANTRQIGKIELSRQDSVGSGVRRIYLKLVNGDKKDIQRPRSTTCS